MVEGNAAQWRDFNCGGNDGATDLFVKSIIIDSIPSSAPIWKERLSKWKRSEGAAGKTSKVGGGRVSQNVTQGSQTQGAFLLKPSS